MYEKVELHMPILYYISLSEPVYNFIAIENKFLNCIPNDSL